MQSPCARTTDKAKQNRLNQHSVPTVLHVSFEDIRALAPPVFRHRILTNFHAESERITTDKLIEQLLDAVPVPKSMM